MRKLKDTKVNTVHTAGRQTQTSQRQASHTKSAAVAPRLLLKQPGQLGVQCQARTGARVTAISNNNLRRGRAAPAEPTSFEESARPGRTSVTGPYVFFLIVW